MNGAVASSKRVPGRQRLHTVVRIRRGVIAMAALAGAVAYLVARIAGVSGAAPLGFRVACRDLIPVVGAFIGARPIISLAAVHREWTPRSVALAFVGYQVVEQVAIQRPLQRRTIKLGPRLDGRRGFAGIELYGIGGAL